MHKAVARPQQRVGLAACLRARQLSHQALNVQPFLRQQIVTLWRAKFRHRQGQVVRQRRVLQQHLGRKQDAHAHGRPPRHEALRKIAPHGFVVNRECGVVVPAFHVALRGATGHEHARSVSGGHTAQREFLEPIDRHRRNVAPAFDRARGFAALLAKALKGQVVLVLVTEELERQCVESVFRRALRLHESQQVSDQGSGDHR